MGCDGGSIPKRGDLVKTKGRALRAEDVSENAAVEKASTCAMSHEPLQDPVVVCELGELYNKTAVLQHLLQPVDARVARFAHIRNRNDVFPVTVTFQDQKAKKGEFVCPISETPGNGKSKFAVIRPCGCLVSEKALEQTGGMKQERCISCGKASGGIINLWPSEDEREVKMQELLSRPVVANSNGKKKSKKRSAKEAVIVEEQKSDEEPQPKKSKSTSSSTLSNPPSIKV
jgi:hypothetical protein